MLTGHASVGTAEGKGQPARTAKATGKPQNIAEKIAEGKKPLKKEKIVAPPVVDPNLDTPDEAI